MAGTYTYTAAAMAGGTAVGAAVTVRAPQVGTRKGLLCRPFREVSDGTRTRGRRDHNPELYQLSYAHQAGPSIAAKRCRISPGR